MATVKSNEYIRQTTLTIKGSPEKVRTGIYSYDITYTAPAGGLAIGDVIQFVALKGGDMLLPSSVIYNGAAGAGATLAVGVAGTPAKYKAATSVATAGSVALDATPLTRAEVPEGGEVLIGTIAGAAVAAGTVFRLIANVQGI